MRPNGELPSDHHADRRKAHLLSIIPARAQGSRRCETQASLRRQAAKAPLAFRSLDPFRALREPDCRRRDEKRPFPLRTKNCQHNPKQPLDRKSPIQVRIRLAPAKTLRTIGTAVRRHRFLAEIIALVPNSGEWVPWLRKG